MMSKKITDIFSHTTSDFSECTSEEKELYVENLIRSGCITKCVLRECLKETKAKGRTDILNNLPTTHGWVRPSTNTLSDVNKAIKKFCTAVPPELLIKHIVLKETDKLMQILDSDKGNIHINKKVYPNFKANIHIEHNIIEYD